MKYLMKDNFQRVLGEASEIPAIDLIEIIIVDLPFVSPFSISSYTWTGKEALLIKIKAGNYTGWGECVADPDPFYSPETTVSSQYIIKEFLIPQLTASKNLAEYLEYTGRVRGNMMAKAAVENALLDLTAKIKGVPLYDLLGLQPCRIMSGISIGIKDSIGELISSVQEAVDLRYHRVKMKIKKGKDIEWVAAVREKFPDLPLMADANGDYSPDDAEHLKKLDEFNLTMIEQPLSYSDIYFHSKLRKEIKTPLCLDESIHSLEDAKTAIELGSCRIINIKQGRVGGMIEALRIADYARSMGVPVWSGGMDETGIGRAFNLHLQSSAAFTLPGDTSETKRYFAEDIVSPPVELDQDGYIDIPEGPGIGVVMLEEKVKKFELRRETIFRR